MHKLSGTLKMYFISQFKKHILLTEVSICFESSICPKNSVKEDRRSRERQMIEKSLSELLLYHTDAPGVIQCSAFHF